MYNIRQHHFKTSLVRKSSSPGQLTSAHGCTSVAVPSHRFWQWGGSTVPRVVRSMQSLVRDSVPVPQVTVHAVQSSQSSHSDKQMHSHRLIFFCVCPFGAASVWWQCYLHRGECCRQRFEMSVLRHTLVGPVDRRSCGTLCSSTWCRLRRRRNSHSIQHHRPILLTDN